MTTCINEQGFPQVFFPVQKLLKMAVYRAIIAAILTTVQRKLEHNLQLALFCLWNPAQCQVVRWNEHAKYRFTNLSACESVSEASQGHPR